MHHDENQPPRRCPRCTGRLFLDECGVKRDWEWACLNCGRREAVMVQPPAPRIREMKRRGLITHDFRLDKK
jgi:DNA-directed RNA polymerase subunit RPC12/RpoP